MEQNEKRQLFRHKLAQFEGWASLTVREFSHKIAHLEPRNPKIFPLRAPPQSATPFVNLRPRRPGGGVATRWLNARFNLGATRAAKLYFATTVTTVTLSDLMNTRTNELFTINEWKHWASDEAHVIRRTR